MIGWVGMVRRRSSAFGAVARQMASAATSSSGTCTVVSWGTMSVSVLMSSNLPDQLEFPGHRAVGHRDRHPEADVLRLAQDRRGHLREVGVRDRADHQGDGARGAARDGLGGQVGRVPEFPRGGQHPLPVDLVHLPGAAVQHPGRGRLRHARPPGHIPQRDGPARRAVAGCMRHVSRISPGLGRIPARDQAGQQDLRGAAQPRHQVHAGVAQFRVGGVELGQDRSRVGDLPDGAGQ